MFICSSFQPDCNVEDDIRFTADNQYVHKMMDRWGPNAKEMRAIVKYIDQHNIHLKHAPLVSWFRKCNCKYYEKLFHITEVSFSPFMIMSLIKYL